MHRLGVIWFLFNCLFGRNYSKMLDGGPAASFSSPGPATGAPYLAAHTRLLDDLLHNYEPRVLPMYNETNPVSLALGVRLVNVIELQEREGILDMAVYLQQMWTDFRLQWQPSEYQGIHVIHIPIHGLWYPDLALYNNADIDYGVMDTLAIVFNHGAVYYAPRARIRSRCDVDLTKFPYDEQLCFLDLGSWTYDGHQIKLTPFQVNNQTFDLSEHSANREWTILNASAQILSKVYDCCPQPHEHLHCTVKMKRNAVYYSNIFILPAVLIAILVPFQFLLPPDSKERFTLGSILLLSILLLLAILHSFLPDAHPNLPYVAQYYCVTMVWVTLSLICSVLILNTRDKKNTKVPVFIRMIFLKGLRRLVCVPEDSYLPLDDTEYISLRSFEKQTPSLELREQKEEPSKKLERDVAEILRHLQYNYFRQCVRDGRDETRNDWRQVAAVIDRVLCYLFFLTFLIYTFALLL